MKAKVANMKADLRMAKYALLAEKATSQETDEEVMRWNIIIGNLEAIIAKYFKCSGDSLDTVQTRPVGGSSPASSVHGKL
jgi:hypothetical protein